MVRVESRTGEEEILPSGLVILNSKAGIEDFGLHTGDLMNEDSEFTNLS